MAARDLVANPAVATGSSDHLAPGLLDALTPPDKARRAVEVGISKVMLDVRTSLLLWILAGAFTALAAVFPLTVAAGAGGGAAGAASLRPAEPHGPFQEDRS